MFLCFALARFSAFILASARFDMIGGAELYGGLGERPGGHSPLKNASSRRRAFSRSLGDGGHCLEGAVPLFDACDGAAPPCRPPVPSFAPGMGRGADVDCENLAAGGAGMGVFCAPGDGTGRRVDGRDGGAAPCGEGGNEDDWPGSGVHCHFADGISLKR